MSSSISTTPSAPSSNLSFFSLHLRHSLPPFLTSTSLPIPSPSPTASLRLTVCRAAKPPTGPVKKRPSNKKKKKSKDGGGASEALDFSDIEVVRDTDIVDNDDDSDDGDARLLPYQPMGLPKPPAGFVVDDHGTVVMASAPAKRIASIVNDEEVEAILPSAAYALAKIHMHLVHSGFCYTARGGFCYSEDDIFDFRTDDGQDVDGLPTEGVEITFFHLDGAQYMIYTPSDPLLFVAVKNQNGLLQIADDDLLEDPAITSAIDEETEFNALVEEEAALLESLKLGEK